MAKPVTARFGKMLIRIGDGADPEVFTAPCGFSSKSLNLSKNLTDIILPDCDDPDMPNWVGRDVESLTASVSGDGLLAASSIPTWQGYFSSNDSKNVQISVEYSTGTLMYAGAMHLESFEISGEQGNRIQNSVSMQSDGEMVGTWTPKAP